jgi:hypothetical protein
MRTISGEAIESMKRELWSNELECNGLQLAARLRIPLLRELAVPPYAVAF